MDYIIADPNLVLENEKKNYSEKIVYLPKIWNSHSGINVKRVYSQSPLLKINLLPLVHLIILEKLMIMLSVFGQEY